MTRIKFRDKPVWHETRTLYDGRELLVAETPSNLLIRRKGTRHVLELPWSIAYLREATLLARMKSIDKLNKKTPRVRVTRGAGRSLVGKSKE